MTFDFPPEVQTLEDACASWVPAVESAFEDIKAKQIRAQILNGVAGRPS